MPPGLHTALKAVRVAWRLPAIVQADRPVEARRRSRSNAAWLLCAILKRLIGVGELTLIDAVGTTHRFGRQLPRVTLKVHDKALHWRLFVNSQLRFGEAYMDGAITIDEGPVRDFAELAARNIGSGLLLPIPVPRWLRRAFRPLQQHNPVRRVRNNVAHHYDLWERLYEAFLDADRQYSCAYFTKPDDTLEVAQLNKKRHIAAKLLLARNQRVLDLGSGWGGLALHLAEAG